MDTQILNSLQAEAINVLLEETLTNIKATMNNEYKELGRANAKLLLTNETRFINNGVIYPITVVKTIPYGSRIPNLHVSLLSELDVINSTIAQADIPYIKNFFIAAVSQSHNAIVLTELLPAVLINALKLYFSTEKFKIIDTGVCGALQQEPISVTQQNIAAIKDHYKSAVVTLQRLLMDKWLLQAN